MNQVNCPVCGNKCIKAGTTIFPPPAANNPLMTPAIKPIVIFLNIFSPVHNNF